MSADLYPTEPFNGQGDYIPDLGLDRIGELVAKLPTDGFDVPSIQGHQKSVTATFKFDGVIGPLAQVDALESILKASTVVRTMHANLVAAREELRRIKRDPA